MNKMKFKDILQEKDGITKGPFGGDIKKAYFVPKSDNTYKVYEQGVVYEKDVNYGNYYIDEERYAKLQRFKVESGDLLLTGAGTLGELFEVPDEHEEGVINQALLRIRLNKSVIDKDFFKLYFAWYIKNIVCRINGDSVIPNLPPISILKETDIEIPDIEYQKSISKVIKVIDDKIEINNAINTELESMAKTLYDYWFLQFEFPNEEGKPYKSSGGKMVWNEELKREIPEGWEVKQLGNLIEYNRGISYTGKDISENGIPIISLASIDRTGRYIPDGIKYFNRDYASSKVVKPFELIMANTDMTQERAVMGKIVFVPDIFDGDILTTHHITQIYTNESLKAYLMMTTQTDWFHNYIKGFASGTNVLGMDMKGFDDYMLTYPSKDILSMFNRIIFEIYRRIFVIYKENFELASLRDFLLPLLMNGQVGFKNTIS